MRVDARTLFRAPEGADEELLSIFLKYNDVLLKRGIGSFNIWMKRAHYLYGLGRYEDAVDALQEALYHDAHHADAHFMLGVNFQLIALERGNGQFEEPLGQEVRQLLEAASLAFEASLELNPDDQEAQAYLTNLRCLLYDPEDAPEMSVLVDAQSIADTLASLRPASAAELGLSGVDSSDDEATAAPA